MYVRGFQLIRGIQHAILQICVCVRRGYANESVCEERVKLGECVRGVFVRIRYCTDVFFVVDVWSCVCYELFPRWTYIGINPYEWTRYSSFLKTHERKHLYRWWRIRVENHSEAISLLLCNCSPWLTCIACESLSCDMYYMRICFFDCRHSTNRSNRANSFVSASVRHWNRNRKSIIN